MYRHIEIRFTTGLIYQLDLVEIGAGNEVTLHPPGDIRIVRLSR